MIRAIFKARSPSGGWAVETVNRKNDLANILAVIREMLLQDETWTTCTLTLTKVPDGPDRRSSDLEYKE